MERQLASIQKIDKIEQHPNADLLEIASILGWKVVVKKGEFQEGDLCVYCEIDSVLPDRPEFEFMRPRKFRVKTIKLRGQLSQGIAFPLNILYGNDGDKVTPPTEHQVGHNVTSHLGVVKYEIPDTNHGNHARLGGAPAGNFPPVVPKTDEIRVQSVPAVLSELQGVQVYITQKMDGTSGTFIHNAGEFKVCSRNFELKEEPPTAYWEIAKKYDIARKLIGKGNVALQGEICGPGIQGNKMKLAEKTLFLFNIYDIDDHKYLDFVEFCEFAVKMGIPTVPILKVGHSFNWSSIDELLTLAIGNYANGTPQEGIVIRPMEEMYGPTLRGRMSFKVINNEFLLKYDA